MIVALALTLLTSVSCGAEDAAAERETEGRKHEAKAHNDLRERLRENDAFAKLISGDPAQQAEGAKTLREMARNGNLEAMKSWAAALHYGMGGVDKDLTKASHWYSEAFKGYSKLASAGNVGAQHEVGRAYEKGHGVKQDDAQAAEWYRKAAEAGSRRAQYRLALMYGTGRGVERNLDEAVKWLRKSAAQGQMWAQFHLGGLYEDGVGVKQDRAEALKWYRKSADTGYKPAKDKLAELNAAGRQATKSPANEKTPEELRRQAGKVVVLVAAMNWLRSDPDIQKRSAKTFKKFAVRGNVVAMRYWGEALRRGQGVEQDTAEGTKWLRKAAAAGDEKASEWLAQAARTTRPTKPAAGKPEPAKQRTTAADEARYRFAVRQWEGEGTVKKNRDAAAKTFQALAERGHVGAMGRWGVALRLGRGVDKDVQEAMGWLQRAAEQLDPEALHHLGIMHANGEAVNKNERTAFKYQAWAAKQGHVSAAMYVGMLWASGKGIAQSKEDGLRWIIQAANEGDPMARLMLASKKIKLSKVAHIANDRKLPDWVEKEYARAKGEQ